MNSSVSALNAVLALFTFNITNHTLPPDIIVFEGVVLVRSITQRWSNVTIPDLPRCFIKCGQTDSCQFAYWDNGCILCSQGTVAASSNGSFVGMKNVNKTKTPSCPTGVYPMKWIRPPTTTTLKPTTTTKTTQKPTTTTPKKSCPDKGWLLIRNQWCVVMVFYSTPQPLAQSKGESVCMGMIGKPNNVLSGLEFPEELRYVIRQAKGLKSPYAELEIFGVWINGQQTKDCSGSNCFPNSFSFNDPHLKNYTGYDWYKDSKGNVPYGGKDTCLQVMYTKDQTDPRYGKVGYARCNPQQGDQLISAVLCGTPAF